MAMAKRERSGHNLAEFAVTLSVLFCVILPLMNLIGLACGAANAYFITVESASAAAVARDFPTALSAMVSRANWLSARFGPWWKVKPVGGLNGCGIDLYIVAVNCYSKSVSAFGPNCQMPEPVDPSTYIYEFQTLGTFDVGPLMNLSSLPYVGNLPILTQPARLTFTGDRAVENPKILEGPGCLASKNNSGNVPSGGGSNVGNGITPGGNQNLFGGGAGNGIGWNFPGGGVVFHTIVPDVNSGGAYLVTINATLTNGPPNNVMEVYQFQTTGQFIQPSQLSSVNGWNQFSTPPGHGFTSGVFTNPPVQKFTEPMYINSCVANCVSYQDVTNFINYCQTNANDAGLSSTQTQALLTTAAAWTAFRTWGSAEGFVSTKPNM
jgi:hypothetical protein